MQGQFQVISSGKSLADCFVLGHSVSIFVPSTVNVDNEADSSFIQAVVDFVAVELSNKFGGGNAESPRKGFWVSDNVGLVVEGVIPVNASFVERTPENEAFIIDLASTVKQLMSQESVYFTIDGVAYLV